MSLYQQKIQNGQVTIQNATKNFDCIPIVDRLKTVSWSYYSHPGGVVKPVYGLLTSPIHTNRKICEMKRTHVEKIVNT